MGVGGSIRLLKVAVARSQRGQSQLPHTLTRHTQVLCRVYVYAVCEASACLMLCTVCASARLGRWRARRAINVNVRANKHKRFGDQSLLSVCESVLSVLLCYISWLGMRVCILRMCV